MTQPLTTTDLEELLEASVPCGQCSGDAMLCSAGHGCRPGPHYKCLQCWQTWLRQRLVNLQNYGFLTCSSCACRFATIESFSDYGPF